MTRNDRASEKPVPSPDADSAQLWRGLRDGVLLLQHCDKCRHVQYYQQGMCRQCGAEDIRHRPACGRGKVQRHELEAMLTKAAAGGNAF